MEAYNLDNYLSTLKEKILKEVSRSRIIEKNKHGRSKEDIQKELREKYERKPFHGYFKKNTEKVRGKRSWDWLKIGYLKKAIECSIVAAQVTVQEI